MTSWEPDGDVLHVWVWLPQASEPTRCGMLELLQGRVCRFSYDPLWLLHPAAFPLAPDLPLLAGSFDPPVGCELHPIFEDAGPDRWGRAVINKVFHPSRRSPLDYLVLAGENRIGALGFSAMRESTQPHRQQIYETADLPALRNAANALAAQQPISPAMMQLLQPGSSAGGARPKAVIRHRDADWIAKFPDREDQVDVAAIEHASLQLASLCGITVAESELIALSGQHVLLVRRFDRDAGSRIHFASARTLLIADGLKEGDMGYADLADVLRREARAPQADCRQLFRRMIFNVLIENTDDHEKNHALLFQQGHWNLSPAFDLQPQLLGVGYQSLRLGKQGAQALLSNALSDCGRFMLKSVEAMHIADEVLAQVRQWEQVFARCGVSNADIDACRRFILRPSVLAGWSPH